jgi:hypothetical protein
LFHWLDENLSDAAKEALASTLKLKDLIKLKDYTGEQIASALVEVFDRIYTYPLLSWRAFARSSLFTAVVSVIFLFEFSYIRKDDPEYLVLFASNFLSDYVSLFVIRSLLTRRGAKPAIGLTLATMSGIAIVLLGNLFRTVLDLTFTAIKASSFESAFNLPMLYLIFYGGLPFVLPAVAVFAWLPLFALGIVVIRAIAPLSSMVAKAQWALKEGDQHPLKAIGCVAAVVVFAVTVGLRTTIAD